MPNKILILDDDADFNSLLTDIFEQADYEVTSLTEPEKAIKAFGESEFDLVVTDQKMPDMTGADFMRAIKKIRSEVPVILVSGYLENDTIRELIGEGVAGVFLKPLNIFSLLARSNEVIAEAKKLQEAGASGGSEGEGASEELDSGLDFPFRSFPCKTEASRDFAKRLYALRDFGSTLTLIGPSGTHFRQICEDVRAFYAGKEEGFLYLSGESFDAEHVLSGMDRLAGEGAVRVTCVLLELDQMSEEQKSLATALAKRSGPFEAVKSPLRLIFCLSGDLDDLFDQGLIDDKLYMLMGTAEVRVPALHQCPGDVGLLAQHLAVEIARDLGRAALPQLDVAARDALRKHRWERNYAELRETILRILQSGDSEKVGLAAVREALAGGTEASLRGQLDGCLTRRREDLICAAGILFGGDAGKVARFFACDDVNQIRAILK